MRIGRSPRSAPGGTYRTTNAPIEHHAGMSMGLIGADANSKRNLQKSEAFVNICEHCV